MNEKSVRVKTADGEMLTYTYWPDGDGPFPAVVLYMDAPGIREELFDFCRRIAGHGYYVLLPDMYYRRGELRFDSAKMGDPATGERDRMFDAMNSLSNKLVMDDTQGLIDFLATEGNAKDGPMGCLGYCMCGQYVMSAAGTYPDHFAATASMYGVGIVTDQEDSPHLLAPNVKGELYFAFAAEDQYVPEHVIPDLKAALDANGVNYNLDVYPATDHGFCFPARPAYVEDAAEKVWAIIFDMYKRTLQS